jgi:hypothetical protein
MMYQQTNREGLPFDPRLDQKRAQHADARQAIATLRQQAPRPVGSGMSLPQVQGGPSRVAQALFQQNFRSPQAAGQPMFGSANAQPFQITPRSALTPEQLAYAREFTNRPAPTGGPTRTLLPMAPGAMPQVDQGAMRSGNAAPVQTMQAPVMSQAPQPINSNAAPQMPIGLTPEQMIQNRTLAPGVRAINPYQMMFR